ncbi:MULTISPECIES: patatin family protein [Bacteroidales]|uniref:patatin-like phospholipase family protein n=1 Tax=Bacteroidales TaxID=171549 RepID=UPI0005738CDC|nr:patatin family protein [Gabonia massiliensis]KHM46072.1 serine protease [Coprobacter secundus]
MVTNVENMGLVLEGGGMRGIFTCGVLDYFMDHNIWFPYVIGVSAGACNGLSYVSRQKGRARRSNIDILEEFRYVGLKYMFSQRNIMDFKLLFDDLPNRILPYDYATYFHSSTRFVMVTSNCLTGKAEYMEEKSSPQRLLDICRASSSLPFVCPVTWVDNIPMLDGGICDSIPVKRAIEEGFSRNVLVLTRNKGYRKDEKEIKVPPFFYRKYPLIRKSLAIRNKKYNETMDMIDRMEDEGTAIVIRPEQPMQVGRIEKDIQKLKDLYEEGVACARKLFS